MLNDYRQIISAMRNSQWLILQESLETILEIVNMRLSGKAFSDEEIRIRLEAAEKEKKDNPRVQVGGGVGVLSMAGPIFPKSNLMTELSGATSLETFRSDLRELLADDSVKQIVMDMDTPGGSSDLIAETGREIREGREIKPIYAVANTLCASGGLWLASQASKFYATESGKVGSLGVYHVHEDRSRRDEAEGTKVTFTSAGKFKTAGNPHEPLTREAQDYIQEHVNETYDSFVEAVAVGRGLNADTVKRDFGQGKLLSPKNAKKVGMIDDIASIEDVLGGLVTQNYQSQSSHQHKALARAVNNMHQRGGELLVSQEEFSEPGNVTEHPELNHDDSADGGWRRDTPPAGEDGTVPDRSGTVTNPNQVRGGEEMSEFNDEQLSQLRELLGLGAEDEVEATSIISHIETLNKEMGPLRDLRKEVEAKKKFAEEYPEEAKQLAELQENQRTSFVKEFAASFENRRITRPVGEGDDIKNEPTSHGFSAQVLETIGEAAEAFSEGTGGLTNVKSILDAVLNNGIVDYGTKGSDRSPDEPESDDTVPSDAQDARQLFHAKVKEIAAKDELEFSAALEQATKLHPKLAEAYRSNLPVQG